MVGFSKATVQGAVFGWLINWLTLFVSVAGRAQG
jgi:hypothetical protein